MSHRGSLDVPATTLKAVTRWLARARRRPGARPAQRAATVHAQVLLVLRWMRQRASLLTLARDARVSIATAYRYLHEGLDAIAGHAPDLRDVLHDVHRRGTAYLCLDGTLIPTDRVAVRAERGNHAWYSGQHRAFGGDVQVFADPTGFPLWTSPVRPGSVHDLTAARNLVLPALYPYPALRPGRMAILADKGYIGAGIGIHTPIRRPGGGQVLGVDNRTYNASITATRAPAERANVLLTGRWHALDRVTLDPARITTITAAALVLTTLERGRW